MASQRNRKNPEVNLNLNVRGMTPSATVAINERCNELRRQNRKIFKLGLGQSPFPVPGPVVEKLRTNAFQKDYLPVKGLHELRRAVAEYYRRTQGLQFTWDNVLVGPGSKELMFLLQLVYYGDLVIPTPSWVSYAPQAHMLGRQVHWVPTSPEDDWHLTPDQLAEICEADPTRPRIVILNYPSNPTGSTYSVGRLKEIARVAREYRVVLLSDEIYGELHHKGQHVSVARFYPEGTIVSGGLSKWCGAGGWRLGVFSIPASLTWLQDAMAAAASETFTSTSAPIQYAAVRAFEGGLEIERYLWHSRRVLGAIGRWCAHRLDEAGISAAKPQGAFYLFADFGRHRERLAERGLTTSVGLCSALLEETGIAILPGSDFGRPPEELTARLAYVDFDGARALAAAEQRSADTPLGERFLREYAGSMLEAVDTLADWVGSRPSRRRTVTT
ncbi:MAG TPA: aminotransferase class I/II-fold pyridoxal phosphate-dependent enzyme [Candidatus Sulfomarinibacteraceae bacterium]|nr:aminotransferase class I/II-fold pyridoxal phosphate-dependent enzyme [Candidatus Sulfomarinibacteraceae bacterium]